jgi:Fe2+ or Zn2+ uptake regulation protein
MTQIQLAILRVLFTADEPLNAVAIREAASRPTSASRTTVYKLLARLTLGGLVRRLPALQGHHNGPPRPRYALSSKGRKVVEGAAR